MASMSENLELRINICRVGLSRILWSNLHIIFTYM